jgi:hypothetical protein
MLTQKVGGAFGTNVDVIDTSVLPEGCYMVVLTNQGTRQQVPFIKAR